MPNGDDTGDGGQAGAIIDKTRGLIRDLAILVAAISALWAAISGSLAAFHSAKHTDQLNTIQSNQAEVKTETVQTQVDAAKTLVNTTGAPEDKKTLVEAEKKLDAAKQAQEHLATDHHELNK